LQLRYSPRTRSGISGGGDITGIPSFVEPGNPGAYIALAAFDTRPGMPLPL
jgi:hypothetical protein